MTELRYVVVLWRVLRWVRLIYLLLGLLLVVAVVVRSNRLKLWGFGNVDRSVLHHYLFGNGRFLWFLVLLAIGHVLPS